MIAMLKGPYGQTMLELSPYPYTIGRAPDNQLVVNDMKASSHHAQIRPEGQGYVIIDLGSSNGTFVNEQRLVPNQSHILSLNDRIRIGDTAFVFEGNAAPTQSQGEATVYAGSSQGDRGYYPPTVSVSSPNANVADNYSMPRGAYGAAVSSIPPAAPYTANSYGMQQGGNVPSPPVQQQKRGHHKLLVILGAIVGVLLLAGIAVGILGYVNRPVASQTLNTFCNALKRADYQTAYNQLSSGLQGKYGSEAVFAAAYATNGELGKITGCTVTDAGGADSGTINYILTGGVAHSLTVDYSLIEENGALKINGQHPHSSSSVTLTTYCSALAASDYQTAYNQLSVSFQRDFGNEGGFANTIEENQIKGCSVSSVDDAVGTGMIAYLLSDGNKVSAAASLVRENGIWKIYELKQISSPTYTLLSYCHALESQDYQAAYNQLSSAQQSQETEAQFAANFSTATVSNCTVSNVNDSAGNGEITYTLSNGVNGTLYYTLVDESGTWKIDSERQ